MSIICFPTAPVSLDLTKSGYWTLFVHGKKLQKSHRIYPRFSCVNTLASSSKNYKLDIAKVDELFGYLNSCIFCVGHPELYHLSREANRSDPEGLTIIPLSNDAEAVEGTSSGAVSPFKGSELQ